MADLKRGDRELRELERLKRKRKDPGNLTSGGGDGWGGRKNRVEGERRESKAEEEVRG